MRYAVAAALLGLVAGPGAENRAEATPTRAAAPPALSCSVTVVLPPGENAAAFFANKLNAQQYIVCPWSIDQGSTQAHVLVLRANGTCAQVAPPPARTLAAGEAQPQSLIRAARVCSVALSSRVSPEIKRDGAYIWRLKMPMDARSYGAGDAPYEMEKIRSAIARSGVPVLFLSRMNGVICMEVPAGERSPVRLLEEAGYRAPSNLKQSFLPGMTCEAAVRKVYGLDLPETTPAS